MQAMTQSVFLTHAKRNTPSESDEENPSLFGIQKSISKASIKSIKIEKWKVQFQFRLNNC